jgi:hypothetical protein
MTNNKPRRAGSKPIPADADEARTITVWATSPAVTEGDLMAALPLYQENPRMQRLLQEAIEQRQRSYRRLRRRAA